MRLWYNAAHLACLIKGEVLEDAEALLQNLHSTEGNQ
jgi:hypothetical protein